MTTPEFAAINNGIQADSVVSGAIAVGQNAQANNYAAGVDTEVLEMLKTAIASLQAAISGLGLPAPAVKILAQDTVAMREMVESGKAEPTKIHAFLLSLKEKLLMAGIVIADVVALAAPIKQIAETFKLPLSKFGM